MTADRHPLHVLEGVHTLGDLLRHHAGRTPDRPACTELDSHGVEVATLTYAELDRRVRDTAALLQQTTAPGDRAMLMLPNGIDFVVAFFACAYAGIVAVPSPSPDAIHGGKRTLGRLDGIVKDADPAVVLTTAQHAESSLVADLGGVEPIVVADVPAGLAGLWRDPGVRPEDPAFLQYTSGSTSAPKGVVLSHGNVLANAAAIAVLTDAANCPPGEHCVVSWLPIFHDMGLAQMLGALYPAGRVVLLPPMALLMRPFVWLDAVSRYRAWVSSAPNFAYELCVAKVTDEQKARLDLSGWKIALNGAEPVRYSTLTKFMDAFAGAGFSPETLRPCYGLAEAVVYISGARSPGDARCVDLDAAALEERGALVAARAGHPARQIVACGRIPANLDVRIVAAGVPASDDRVGEIWVAGDSVSSGYWRQPEATAARFGGRLADRPDAAYLQTGDLGFIADGQLFVLGRIDDLIIVDGRNHYPTDIERTVSAAHPAIAADGVAAFPSGDDGQLGIVAETARQVRVSRDADGAGVPYEEVVAAVRRAVSDEHQLHVASVTLLRPGGLPRTTSGKVQRKRSRDLLPDGGAKAW
ncbi:fatty acyl-AMP ligase [Dactylosporangium sp. NPDC005555]|uniref:fatty acyl-AMP ligase n=1 Tax=Dactylosporangium sp. NPDC005555 TaxID=3154889 RepID=UPI0033B0CB58